MQLAAARAAAMTDRSPEQAPVAAPGPTGSGARAPRIRRPGPLPVISGAIALFAVSFGFLTYQLQSGNDPALGAQAIAGTTARRPVIVRRVIKRRVITRVVPTPGATAAVPVTTSAPVTTSSAAVASAPTPAPVTTSAS